MRAFHSYLTMIRKTRTDRLFLSFLVFFCVDCMFIYLCDPGVATFGDALWIGFNVATTIGLGDMTLTGPIARILASLIGLYGIVIAAVIPGLIASHYLDATRRERDESLRAHARQLFEQGGLSEKQKRTAKRLFSKGWNPMKRASLFALIIKRTKTVRFLLAFAAVFVFCSLVLWRIDPVFGSWQNALWYGFMVVTTTGFGDFVPTTLAARLVSVFLGVYGVIAMGFLCGVGASWLFERVQTLRGRSSTLMLHQLEHLGELDDDQLEALRHYANEHADRLSIPLAQSLIMLKKQRDSSDEART